MTEYVSVSLQGNKELKAGLKALASLHRTSSGVLVRRAIDSMYGDDLEKILLTMSNEIDIQQTKKTRQR